MQTVPYNDFVATVDPAALTMLTAFVVGQRVQAADATEAATLEAQADSLFQAGMVTEYHVIKLETGGQVITAFDGFATTAGKAYIGVLAKERVILSRDPVPAP